MKSNLLLLALPALCLACSLPETADSASDAAGTASPFLAKQVSGIHMISPDANYDKPCHIIGEEYVRNALKLGEEAEISEVDNHDGCAFEWNGSKIVFAFAGHKPYESIQKAEYMFDRKYQDKKAGVVTNVPVRHEPTTEGTASDLPTIAKTEPGSDSTDTEESPSEAPIMPLTPPAVSTSEYVATPGIGDKAVWEPAKNTLHVLYVNHILSVTVDTKDRAALRKQHALSLAEVMIDKIHSNEYKH